MFGFFNSRKSLAESGLLKGSTDNHSHILYGVDDGVKTLEESLQILSFMETSGVKHIWLTPHVMEDVPNTTEFLRTRIFCSMKEIDSWWRRPPGLALWTCGISWTM